MTPGEYLAQSDRWAQDANGWWIHKATNAQLKPGPRSLTFIFIAQAEGRTLEQLYDEIEAPPVAPDRRYNRGGCDRCRHYVPWRVAVDRDLDYGGDYCPPCWEQVQMEEAGDIGEGLADLRAWRDKVVAAIEAIEKHDCDYGFVMEQLKPLLTEVPK